MSDLVIRTEADDYKPVMSITAMLEQKEILRQYINAILVESTEGQVDGDYGVIPGTGKRKVLLLPGAQKLCQMRGLSPDYEILSEDEDWTGERHGGEPFFKYNIKCILYREDRRMGSGVGACNSFEEKYRYVKGERTCPACGAGAIITGKKEYGGGFICFAKKGGCGAKFGDGDTRITAQPTGKVENPNPADLQNTILKMAKKRSYIDATLSLVAASEFFTQDVEDQVRHTPEPPVQQRPQMPPQRHNEQVYEAEYVPTDKRNQEWGEAAQKAAQSREDARTEAGPAPTINKAQASAQLKAVLSDLGWEPVDAEAYKKIMRYMDNDTVPEKWTTQDFLTAAALPKEILDDAIKAMYVPSATEQPLHHTTDAAAKYQSPAAAIKESLNNVA